MAEIEPSDNTAIDPRRFIKQLAPDQLGLFEPLSAIMLLNIQDAEFEALGARLTANECTDADIGVIRTINHETYHFAQAAASGYVFQRQARAFAVFNRDDPLPDAPADDDMAELLEAAKVVAEGDPDMQARIDRMTAVLEGHHQLAAMEARAEPGDHSVMGAMFPAFFAHLRAQAESERAPGNDGLSITGLLEGSAVLHTHLLMHPNGDAHVYVNAELATLPPVYHELVVVTAATVGERTLELSLPATALALHYAKPQNAYLPLLRRLAESPQGDGLAAGRALLAAMPVIDGAGPVLGDALAIRAADDTYRVYDPVHEQLRSGTWAVDCYDFLAEPAAMHEVASFPMGVVTADGYHGALPLIDLVGRMALMAAVLRVEGRRRAEREFRQFQVAWARDVLNRLMDGMPTTDQAPP